MGAGVFRNCPDTVTALAFGARKRNVTRPSEAISGETTAGGAGRRGAGVGVVCAATNAGANSAINPYTARQGREKRIGEGSSMQRIGRRQQSSSASEDFRC